MKLGFFGGSFNPPTIAHYNLIKQALLQYNFDKVYFVPMNDYYPKAGLVSLEDRINMLEKMCKNDENICVSTIENEFKEKSTAIDSLRLIEKRYINDDIYFFMGEDNFSKMKYWKDYENLKKYNYIVFQRNEKIDNTIDLKNVIYMKNSENLSISSTIIRSKLKKNENIDEFVTGEVKNYIFEKGLYL